VWGNLLHSSRKRIHCPRVTFLNLIRFGSFCLSSECRVFFTECYRQLENPSHESCIVLYSLGSTSVWLGSFPNALSSINLANSWPFNPVYEPFMGDGFNISKVTPPPIKVVRSLQLRALSPLPSTPSKAWGGWSRVPHQTSNMNFFCTTGLNWH